MVGQVVGVLKKHRYLHEIKDHGNDTTLYGVVNSIPAEISFFFNQGQNMAPAISTHAAPRCLATILTGAICMDSRLFLISDLTFDQFDCAFIFSNVL